MRRFVTPSILVATILAAPGAALAKGAMCGDQSRCRFRVPEFQPLNYRLAIFWAVDSGYVFTSERGGPFTTTAASPGCNARARSIISMVSAWVRI